MTLYTETRGFMVLYYIWVMQDFVHQQNDHCTMIHPQDGLGFRVYKGLAFLPFSRLPHPQKQILSPKP